MSSIVRPQPRFSIRDNGRGCEVRCRADDEKNAPTDDGGDWPLLHERVFELSLNLVVPDIPRLESSLFSPRVEHDMVDLPL